MDVWTEPNAFGMAGEEGDGLLNGSTSELISFLRTSFRTKEFDEVKEILVAREVRLKKEVEKKQKENEFLENKCEVLRVEKARVEAELNEVREKAEELLNMVNKDRSERQERKKRAVERYEKLLQEKRTIVELRDENSELKNSKKRVEDDVELWRKRFEELGTRVPQLEKKLPNMINGDNKLSKNIKAPLNNLSSCSGEMIGKKSVAGNGAVSPGITVPIIDSDGGNNPGNIKVNHEINVKRKRDSFDNSRYIKPEVDDEDDNILISKLSRQPQKTIAYSDSTSAKNKETEKLKSQLKEDPTVYIKFKPSSLNSSGDNSTSSSDYDDAMDLLFLSRLLSPLQRGKIGI